jgi:hypothetical protein
MTFIQARPPFSPSLLLTPGHTLLLIDAGLADLDILISGLNPGVVPFVVQPDQDVLEALEAALSSPSSFETLALVAHGKPGEVLIGHEAITRASLERRSTRWAALASLGIDSIHLFACHVGQDQAFVDGLSSITCCPVAAAATTIGHTTLGAVWQLDVSSTACLGTAEAKPANSLVPFTRASQASWVHELATYYIGTPTSGNGNGSSGNPWNQAGFEAVSGSTTGDTLSIASGYTLTTTASKVAGSTVTGAGSLALTAYTNQDIHLVSPGGTLSITTAAGASLTSANLPGLVNSLVLGGAATADAGIFSRDPSVGQLGADGANLNVNSQTLSISNWIGQRVNGLIRGYGTDGTVNVTAANGFSGGLWRLGNADSLTIPQGASGALSGTLPNLATNGFVINGTVRTLSPADAASMAAYINGTGTLNLADYTSENLSGLTNIATVNVTTATGAVLDATKLAPVDSITIGAGTASGTAAAIDTLGDAKVTVASGATLNISGYTTQTLGGMANNGTINVTTANGAVLDATNLADATSITIGSGTTATSTATAIDALGPSTITVTGATLNISDTAVNLAASSTAALTLGSTVAVTGTTATAADLNTIDSKISVALNASSVTSLTGTASDVNAAYLSNTAGTISGLGNEAVTLSDTSLAASLLNSVNSKTTGLVNASSVTTLSGTSADVKSAYTANGAGEISGLGDEAVTLSGSTSVADANSVDGSTSGAITATITETAISSLSGLTGTGNAYTISVTDASVDAAALNTLDGKSTVNVNAGSVGTLTGTAAAIDTAINAGTIDTGAAVAVNVNSGSATVAQANSIDAQTTGVVTATISETAISILSGLNGTGNAYSITVNDASVDAGALNTLDSKTTVNVNAGSVGTLTGSAGDIVTAISATTIDTGAAVAVNVNSGSATVAQANSIDAQTTGVVTATISQGDLSTLAGLTGTGNAYTITLSDTSAAANALNTLDGKTTVSVNAASVTTLTGAATDVMSAYTANTAGTITGLGNEAVSLIDTFLVASVLNTINSSTSGVVNAASVTTLSGAATDVKSAYTASAASEISGLGDEAVTLTGSTSVADANIVDGSTSGAITATITETAISSLSGLTGTGNAYTISVNDASVDAAALNTLDGKTTVNVNAGSVGTLTGTAAAIDTAINASTIDTGAAVAVNVISGSATVAQANSIDAQTTGVVTATISETAISTLSGLTGTGNAYTISVNDASVDAGALNTLDGKTTVNVNAGSVGTLTGSAADIATAISATTIDTGAAVIATVTGNATVAQVNTIDTNTTGVVTATISDHDISTLAGLNNSTGNAYTISVTDASVDAADLNTLDGKTTVNVEAGSVGTLTGTVAAINTAINASTIDTGAAVAVNVNSGSATVAQANSIDAQTTGVVTATISETAISSLSGLTGTGNAYSITVNDASVDAAALNTLDTKTTVNVNAGSVGTLTGTAAAIDTAINASTIDTGAAVVVTVSSGSATVAQANSIDAQTTGVVTATISETAISTLSALTGTGNAYSITVTDASVDAAALNTLDGKTTVNVNAGSVGTLTGTAAAIDTAINASTIDTGSAVLVNVNSGSATVAQANSIDAQTTGVVTATISQGDLTTLATLTGTGNAYTVTLSDTTAAASALTTLDGKTTVAVNAGSVTTLSGTAAEVNAAYSANTAGSISGLGDEAVTLSDTTLAATALNAVNSNTSGVVNATSVTTLTGLLADVNTAYAANAANTISGLGDEAVTINNGTGTLLASDLSTAGNATTGTVTVTNTQTVAGTVAEVTAALVTASTKVVMGTASAASISDAATAAQGAPIATTANVTANFSLGIVDSLANLASSGTISSNLSSITADQPAVVLTINNAGGGTMAAADLSAVGNASTGTVTITNTQTVNGTADEVIAAVVTTASKVNLNTGSTINASTYNTQDLSGVDAAFTLNVTTINGAVLDATKLATADSVTLVGTNTATGAHADTLGSRLGGTATLNITTDPITANTDLSDLGSGLSLQFGGDTTAVVTGATLTVRQDQVSGYAISGTGTVAAAATANSDTFDASSITATTNFTSLGGNDRVTMAPSALGSVDSIDGGSGSDTLTFSAAGTVVDGAFTYVSSVEVLQLAAGTNSITLGVEAEQAGISTVTGDTGADTLNLLYGTTALTFNAGTGTDTLSYSADSAAQAITLSGISSGTASGSVVNNATDSFTGLEAIVGGSGTGDTITSTSAAEALIVTGANAGTIDGFSFSGVESVDLGAGNDSGTINTGGSLSGSLNFGTGTDTLTYASYGSAVSASLSGTNTLTSITAINGGVTGVDNLTLSSSNDTLTVSSSGSLSGNLDFGAGSDTLSYAGNSNAITVSLNGATSAAAAGATGITGTTSGFETLIGGGGSSDILNATSGGNAISVASNGTTTLDTNLTVSAFETINLGANSDASADTATISGAFSGTMDLGDGADTATINNGGSVTSLVGGAGSDTLNLDSANQTITVTGTGAGTSLGSTGGTTTFSGFETVNGLVGNDGFTLSSAANSTITIDGGGGTDSLSVASSDLGNNSLTISGAGSGSLGTVTFAGMESIALSSGNDSASVSSVGSLSGNLDLGAGNNSLTLASGAGSLGSLSAGIGNDTITINGGSVVGAVNVGDGTNQLTVSGTSSSIGSYTGGTGADSITLSGGDVGGNVDLGTGANTLLISTISSSIGGAVTFGSGTSDTLSYAGYGNAVTVSLNSATSTAAAGATGITGAVTGFESLVGGSGNDTLTANAGANTLTVAADGTTTLDINLTVSGFETINLGANADASADSASISGAFNGTVDLGAGNDTATINNGGSVTSLSGGAGSGDTLNLDGANQTIRVTATGAGTSAGTSGSTTTFANFESVNGLAGDDAFTVDSASTSTISLDGGTGTDSLSVANTDTAANSLTISGAGSGTLGNVTFSGLESIVLGSGGDTATVNSGGSLSGNLDLGAGNNTLTLATGAGSLGSLSGGIGNDTITINGGSVGGPVNVGDGTNQLTVSGTSSSIGSYTGGTGADSITLSGGDVGGNVDLGTGSNSLLISSTSSAIGGAVTFGSGTSDSLSYAGYGSAVSLTLSGITSNAGTTTTGGATGISGIASGFESLTGSSNSDSLVASEAGNTLILTGANQGTVDGFTFASFESVDLAGGNDSAQFTSGDSLSGTLAGGSGSDTLDYSGYGSSVNVNLAAGTATGTGGISGFETVLGGASADTITASTSGDVNLQGNAGADTFNVTVAGLTSGDTIDGGADGDTLVVTDAGTITDSQFTNVTNLETVTLTGATTISAGSEASQAGVATINTGTGATTVNSTATGYDLTVNAANLADSQNLTLSGSANTNDFTVTNLTGSVLAGNTSGTLSVTTGDAIDNAIGVTTGTGATTITADGGGDTVTTDATRLGQNTLLSLFGAARQVVTNLVGNLTGSNLSGSLNVSTANAADNGISITTGSGNVVVQGGDATDTVTVTGLNTNNQTFTAQTSTANLNITAGANDQTITASNTGSDTIAGGSGTDTLSYAGGSNVDVTISSYATQSGGSTGQGTDTFSGIESLVGATGTDTLRGTTANTDEVATVSGANSGTIRDSASTGSFAFSSFEQLDLKGGNDSVTFNGNTSGVSLTGGVDLGSGTNSLTMSGSAGSIASITSSTGDDTISIKAGSVTGAVSASDGSNTVTISGTNSSIGSYTGGSGTDSLTLSGGDVAGNVSTGTGNDTLLINSTSSAVGGNLDLGGGTGDTLSYGGPNAPYGASFDGSTSYAAYINEPEISVSREIVFSTTSGGGLFSVDNAGSGSTGGHDRHLAITSDGNVYSRVYNNETLQTTGLNLTDGATHRLVFTLGADGTNIYVDGTRVLHGNLTASSFNWDVYQKIGTSADLGGTSFNGTIDSYRTWNTELTADQANGLAALPTPVHAFEFNNNTTDTGSSPVTLSLAAGTNAYGVMPGSGYTNAVSVTLSDITNNTGSTAAGGATAITGTATGFETLEGGSNNADTITDATGDSTLAITGANSGTLDGMAFSTFENLNLSGGNDTATVSGNGSGLSLYGNLDLGEGTNSLTMNGSAGTVGSVNSGTGNDIFSISAGSVIGAVNASDGSNTLTISGTSSSIGSYLGGSGTDSITLSGGDVVGNVSTTTGNDTLLISSTASTIGGNLDLGGGTGDTLSYVGYSNAVSVTLTDITSNTGSTAAGGATAISGTTTGFESLIGGSSSSDSVTDSTGDSTIVISGPNSGTIDGLAFSSIEYLNLSTGIDGVTVQSGGSLSGNLDLADGSSNSLLMNSGAGSIASVSSSSGNDTFTLDGGSVTGSITAGDGSNSVTINNTNSSIGSYTGGSGIDTIESKGGDILGALTTGSAADSVTLTLGATITGAVSLGANSDSSDGNDLLSLNASSISGTVNTGSGADTVSLASTSSISSDVTLGANSDSTDGNDSLTLNASTITGNVNTGSGADGVSVLTTSTINGNVTLGTNSDSADGADSLTVTGSSSSSKSVITGSITTGPGGDSLNLTNATIGGSGQTITLGSDNNGLDGNDSLIASGTAITAAITTGSGADSLTLSASSSVTGNVSLGIDGDTPAISDSFDSLSGWTGGTLETSSSYYGNFLGRYSNGSKTNGQDVSKSFTLNSQPATLSFDFIKLDSWDAENFRAYINDTVAFTGNFRYDQAISSTSGTTNGFSWTIAPKDSYDYHGFAGWQDQTATITISLPSGYSNVKIGFGSDLNSGVSDESYGIDNLSIIQSNINSTDTLTLNASTITGDVTTGSGADGVSVLSGSKITGSVNLGSNSDVKDSGDSLTVTGVASGTKSEITGSITTGGGADTLTLTDATIGSAGQTISLGSDNNSNDGNDALNASGTAITAAITTGSGSDSVSLSVASSVAGNVTLGSDGDTTNGNTDNLSLNASTITGNVVTGSGADGVSVLNTSTITGNVTLGSNSDSADSGDTLTVTGASSSSKSVVTGSIATGAGADSLTLTNATIGGAGQTISLGTDSNSLDGNDLLSASGTAITATITGGSGADELTLSAASTVSGNINLGIDGDTTTASNADSLSLDASNVTGNVTTGSGADAVSVLNTSKITGNVTLGSNTDSADGADSLTVTGTSSSSKSEITGSITTGGGADILTLTNATIGSAGQTISLGSDTNALEGNDRLNASGTSITANITTGSGSDSLSLSAGSSVTGDVTLGSVGDNQAIIDFANSISDSFNSATGWSGGTVDSSNSYYGSFLGRYAAGTKTNGQDVYKSFSLSNSPATISFDFIRLDSWDGESFKAYVNDTEAFSRSFTGGGISSGSGTTNGFTWTIAPKDSLAGHGFAGWSDQTATITITLPAGYTNFNKLGFGSTLDQGIDDESYGIDNLTIIPTIVSHDDSLTLDASSISGNVSTGSAADTVRVLNASTITGNVNLGSNTDSTDGADILTVTGANSSTKSVVTGSIATGASADTLTLTDATIGGDGQTISLGSDSNSLDGNDSLNATGTAITAAITTGSGSDRLILSAGSSVTGNVTLGANADNDSVNDTFDSLSGWTGGALNTSSSYFGSFLGRYGSGSKTNGQDVSKSFTLSTQPATISFDFIKFDTWDGEAFTAYINDTPAFTSSFRYGQSISSASGSTNSFNWTIAPKDSLGTHGFGGWENQTATITITLPPSYANFNKLGFGSNLDEGISNESYGIDNLTITPIILSNDDGLSLDASSITGNVTTGTAADTVTLSNSSTITGSLNLGSNTDANDGNDSLTLSSGSNIVGNVDLGAANDTLTLSTGISSATTIKGDVAFGVGNADTISYSGNAGPITVALNGISADAVGSATGAYASYVTGNVTGFETIVGSDYSAPTSSGVTGDTIYDNTGASLVVLSGANAGTIDNLDFSSIENLQLRSGADTLSFQGSSGAPGLIAGRADGGGVDGATYTNGVYSGGTQADTGIDLLDYTAYQVSTGASVDLSQNKATGVFGGAAGGLISGNGSIATTTTDSSFENVDGSRFNDTIIGDDQTSQANVLRGFDGADTIKGLAGNDVLDGGNGVGSNITDGADSIQGGDGADTILGSFGNDSISGGSFGTTSDASIDTLTYSATSISSARIEGLDISLVGTDTGTVLGDAYSLLTVGTFTSTYNPSINLQLISAPTNQLSNDWTQSYTDIQNLVLSEQSDILRIDTTDVSTGTIDAKGGSLDTLDYSSFDSESSVVVNLSGASYSFDFDANGTIDTKTGEITLNNAYSATNVKVGTPSSQGGANGVSGFEVVIGGAADDAIVGNASANLLVGNAGDDRIDGGAGSDTIYGGTGDDYIIPGEGADYIDAGAGINTIIATSSDIAQDYFNPDPNGVNEVLLEGNGSDKSTIDAPTGYWNPGAQGIDVLNGGDPISTGGTTTYDTVKGTSANDNYQFGSIAFKNVSDVSLGDGSDSVGTAATTKGVKVNYDGGSGSDKVTLNFTFDQLARLNASGTYVKDVQNYLDDPNGKTFSSTQADFTANNFESGGMFVITPGVQNALQGDPAAVTINSAYGAINSTITSGDDVNLSTSALTTSSATALSVSDIVSAIVQANGVKGSDAISVTSGGNTTGSTTASQDASAVTRTVVDRADSVISAYGIGTDRSSLTAGQNLTLNLSGNVKADTSAESLGFVVKASGIVETAGSRDSSLTAADALSLTISGTTDQVVRSTNVEGLAVASLASRTYGIDDANLTDSTTDSVQGGTDVNLQATANSSNRVSAQTVGNESLGTLTLVDNGAARTDRFKTSKINADFPLINGDRVRFTTSNGSVQADRDYYVFNVMSVTGEFQLSSEPNGSPINVAANDSLQAYRPAVATADAFSTVTGVDLNRTGSGVQAGDTLTLRASAADALAATATSVAGDATAGVFRLGGMDGLNLPSEVANIQGLVDTASVAGSGASFTINATDSTTLKADTAEGTALTEANIQVFGSKSSASTAGDDLSLNTQAALTVSGSATSTAGSAEARSGAGAGSGVTTAGVTNVLPNSNSYAKVTGLADGTQTAGADLAVQSKASTTLNATASTVSGAETLGSLWISSRSDNILATFNLNDPLTPSFVGPQYLAAGQVVQLDASSATATGLTANTDYAVKLLGFGAVDDAADTLTMPTGITYQAGDAVRFRLNSSTAPNTSESRYGLALGTTYYVKTVTGTAFTLSASPGGATINLSADSLGPADQLVDADRFQLLTPPAAAGGTYTVAVLAPTVPTTATAPASVSLTLPSVANAFAGSREADRTLNTSDSLNLAQVSGITGNGGLRSLISGAQSAISAVANGVLNAFATNTGNDATASAGLVAEGLKDTAIIAGSTGTVIADASIKGVADASTIGNNGALDNALADLTITARGLTASNAANDITIGSNGDVEASATLTGRSSASTVTGDSDALANLQADALRLDVGNTITIADQGSVNATASIGSSVAPLLVSAVSAGVGDASSQMGLEISGILGSSPTPGTFSSMSMGGGSLGTLDTTAEGVVDLSATATNGTSSINLGSTSGGGIATITGMRNTALNIGADLGQIDATATGFAKLSSLSVAGDATITAASSSYGILSDTGSPVGITLADQGQIAVLANQKSVASATSVVGQASSSLSGSSVAIDSVLVNLGATGQVRVEAVTDLLNRAESVSGAANA